MILEEMVASRRVPHHDIAAWAAGSFGIADAAVVVESADDRGGPLGDEIELLVEMGEQPGDFPALVSLFARSPRTERAERAALVAAFARSFDADVLVSDTSLDPYRMIRVSPDGSRTLVRLNPEALDSADAFVVDGPYTPEAQDA